ncbi:DUF3967 domain-containing protein (plasmid) [Brevibacterium sp. JNUCC-42]|nr:DUF3967 domain-containing protein [Brevibacterium sp. JNUCC-42]
MEKGIYETDVTFWGKHIAETLGIATVTLRKWSLELEKQGWTFHKDDQQRRSYTQSDYVALRYLHDLMKDKRRSLENACIEVVRRYSNPPETLDITGYRRPDIEERHYLEEQLKLLVVQQMEFMQQRHEELSEKLVQRLDDQERYIEERLKLRDETLTKTLNEIMETKKLIAVAQEKPRKKWYQFWK